MTDVQRQAPELKADKGLKNGSCNREACQAPGANHFNRSTRLYYCAACAEKINSFPETRDYCENTFGTADLCVHDEGPHDLRFKPLPYLSKDTGQN